MFGGGPVNGGGGGLTRGRIQGSPQRGMMYPSPFFDVGHTYLPTTVRQLFRWCRYYFLTSPLINAAVFKMSEYPVTEVIIDHGNKETAGKWQEYLEDKLKYRSFQIEVGLDYNVYGNAYVSVVYPFIKYLKCPSCAYSEQACRIRQHWRMVDFKFRLTCPKCGATENADVQDVYIRNKDGIRLRRWNPEDVDLVHNEVAGTTTYFYTPPPSVTNDVVQGKKEVVEKYPQLFLQAMAERKSIVFSPGSIFHFKRPSISGKDAGYGTPIVLPVLKDLFQLQIMRKAQEALLLEHILPLRTIFPQAASGTSDVFTTVALVDWKEQVGMEIARWRQDPGYIPIMPLPMGNQTIGGDGKALLMTAEMQQGNETVLAGMGVPREFIFGGLTYSGSNVSMRILENGFLSYIKDHKLMLSWIIREISTFLNWVPARARFKAFKMADDLQRKAFDLQLNQLGKISDTTLLSGSDYDQQEENEIMRKEAPHRLNAMKAQRLMQAEVEGEAMLVQSKYQAKAQALMMAAQQPAPAPGEPGAAEDPAAGTPGGQDVGAGQDPTDAMGSPLSQDQEGGGMDVMMMAQTLAQSYMNMPPDQQASALQNLEVQSPDLASLVKSMLSAMQGQSQVPQVAGAPVVDARPNPTQRPPTRANASV